MVSKKLVRKENLPLLISFLVGIIIGFLIAPTKKGVSLFSYNGNYNGIGNLPTKRTPQNIDN